MYQSYSLADRGAQAWSCDDIAALIARENRVSIRLIMHSSRCRVDAARARQLAMYLAHTMLGQSLADVGEAFGRDRTTVSYACKLIEDLRDDREFEAAVTRLEGVIEHDVPASVTGARYGGH